MDYYFIQDDGDMFKTTLKYSPYFYIATKVTTGLLHFLVVVQETVALIH